MDLIKFLVIMTLAINPYQLIAKMPMPVLADKKVDTMLVFDEDLNRTLPKNFRSDKILKASASAQFSVKTLKGALEDIPSTQVWLIDLRRESHGFINDYPISLYLVENQSNQNLKTEEILKKESDWISNLKAQRNISINKILGKEQGTIKHTQTYQLKLDNAKTESDIADDLHLHYLRLPVADHHRPNIEEIDQFVQFVKQVPDDAWLYFHCRGGKGRSSTFMVLYDILRNGNKDSLEQIMSRQAALGGSDLFRISDDPSDTWKKKPAIDRRDFIKQFYEYATSKDKGYPYHTFGEYLKAADNSAA